MAEKLRFIEDWKEDMKREILAEMEEKKRNGQHKEWFEETCCQVVKDARIGTPNWRMAAWRECMQENQVPGYEDEDFLRMLVDKTRYKDICLHLVWYGAQILGRRVVWNMNSDTGKRFLNALIKGGKEQKEQEDVPAFYYAAMSNLRVERDMLVEGELKEEEKIILGFNEKELCAACCKNGFFRREKVEDYLEYSIKKGYLELVPVFIMLKYREEENVHN